MKVILGFLFSLCLLVGFLGVLEGGSSFWLKERQGQSLFASNEAAIPQPPPPNNAKFALYTDWSFLPYAGYPTMFTEMWRAVEAPEAFSSNINTYPLYTPGFHAEVTATTPDKSKILYKAKYTIDRFGRRMVPPPAHPEQMEKHLIISGCSYVFGKGIDDEDSLPAQLQGLTSKFRLFNLGRSGGSVADSIATLTKTENWNGIEPTNGYLLVSFIGSFHLMRFLGTIRDVGTWHSDGASLETDPKSGRYIFKGTHEKIEPIWTAVSRILAQSDFLRLMGFDWPRINAQVFHDYAKGIADLRSYYREKYGAHNQVIVYIQPAEGHSRGILPYLEEMKIPYLDYTDVSMDQYARAPLRVPHDGHPTAEFNRILAQLLNHDLADERNQAFLNQL